MEKTVFVKFVLVFLLNALQPSFEQDEGWVAREAYEYYFSAQADTRNVENARQQCKQLGGDLLSIASKIESDFISSHVTDDFWTGLTTENPCDNCTEDYGTPACSECRSGWQWSDNTSYIFQNWRHHTPDSSEPCARLHHDGTWGDRDCSAKYRYICKRPEKDECSEGSKPHLCVHGKCRNTIDGYECLCTDGYYGDNCSFSMTTTDAPQKKTVTQDKDECNDERQQPLCVHGVCQNTIGGFECQCRDGYYGDDCSLSVTTTETLLTTAEIQGTNSLSIFNIAIGAIGGAVVVMLFVTLIIFIREKCLKMNNSRGERSRYKIPDTVGDVKHSVSDHYVNMPSACQYEEITVNKANNQRNYASIPDYSEGSMATLPRYNSRDIEAQPEYANTELLFYTHRRQQSVV